MSATILEIARRLNLSHSTVSRVLNGKRNTAVADETRSRVLKAAREMGYRPNLAARSMRDARSNLVALFASPMIGIWSSIAPDIVRGITPVLQEHRLDLFYAFAGEANPDAIPAIPPWRYDAALIFQFPTTETVERLRASGRPAVTVNERVDGFPGVLSDEADGIRQAIKHLVDLGHRRIAYANASGDFHFPHYSVQERHAAYVATLRDYGLSPVPGHEHRPPDRQRIAAVRQAFVEGHATAVITYDHVVAMDVVAAAEALRLRIPEDLSLISFNNAFPLERLQPAVTVVDPDGTALGAEAARRLIARITDQADEPTTVKESPSDVPTRVRPRMILRESTRSVSS
ncbi:MAG: LacI family DNA-binding transcriptional regulator [Capsulimonadales bacterium]|nr:LacI family DNA-binding transcriptional regulator [Capsulimonadales bacterium]